MPGDFGALDPETQAAIRESQRKRKAAKEALKTKKVQPEPLVDDDKTAAAIQAMVMEQPAPAENEGSAGHWQCRALSTVNSVTVVWSIADDTPDLELKLQRTTLLMGDVIQLHGLVGAAQHNGKQGSLRGFDQSKGRYQVSLEGSDQMLVKPANITLHSGSAQLEGAGILTTSSATVKAASLRHTFYPLTPDTDFTIEIRRSSDVAETLQGSTEPFNSVGNRRPSWGCSRWGTELFISAAAVGERQDLHWTIEAPGDWLWAACWEREFLIELYQHAIFTLPCSFTRLLMLPNPVQRYCIDLTAAVRWDRSRIMRPHRRDAFRLTVNADYGGSLRALAAGHEQQSGGTWFTDELLELFEAMAVDPSCPVQQRVFELWDAVDGTLVAVTAGFGVGRAFHDYSMCTLRRDDRSAGSVLTRAVAHLLRSCGYGLWYWGYKNAYMHEYDSYGGREFARSEFFARWNTLAKQSPLRDVRDLIREGGALIKPRDSGSTK